MGNLDHRDPADRFRQYADVAGEVRVAWMGETDKPHRAREKNNLKSGAGSTVLGLIR